MAQKTSAIYKQPAYRWGSLTLFVTIAIILGALGFEYIGGYKPCPLCLQQRYAYYVAIPLLFLALILLSAEQHRFALALLFFVSMVFLANSAFGVYHAGAEWGFWAPPTTCGGTGEALQGGAGKIAVGFEERQYRGLWQAGPRYSGPFAGRLERDYQPVLIYRKP